MKFKIIPNKQTPKTAKEINPELMTDEVIIIFEKFVSFASRQNNCVGLAANQCTLDGRRIELRFFAIKIQGRWDIVINPNIRNYRGKGEEMIETCLTWLGKYIKALRWYGLSVEYFNIKGEKIIRDITGIEAQIWQHELNHLDGIEEEFTNE